MPQPDQPNFSVLGRIVFGLVALVVIYILLKFFGFLPT